MKTIEIRKAFIMSVPNSITVLDDLRKATRGAASDIKLMQSALRAKNFGIPLEALPKLLEFAAVRAQQTGQSVDSLVNLI